jgi:pimeloyl-ACP methyl ester carboxylesterase
MQRFIEEAQILPANKEKCMSTFTTKDGTAIYYKDWGSGSVVTFSHGWPLSADAWDAQMLYFGKKGYRVIAHDRRGHGRSGQSWHGNDMNQYADDLAELMQHLDIRNATMVGHSTGGGEVARYIARHGQQRVSKVVLIAACPVRARGRLEECSGPSLSRTTIWRRPCVRLATSIKTKELSAD